MHFKIAELEDKINDIKKRMPAHSVKPEMVQALEELEEQLEQLKAGKTGGGPGQGTAPRPGTKNTPPS